MPLTDVFPPATTDCLIASRRSHGAGYVVKGSTTDGDPIEHHFFTDPDSDSITLFVDTTRDEYSKQGWIHRVCSIPEISAAELAACMQGR
ncbi:hypothetical protein [Tomitella fengzijianii]|uniref:Uncharacterized protein n=1 Tax=Tomitella fengzijianii TaxID=2597660 RepID=A0A516X6P8_9ACTN|nr:hypothetical protein [Tomitella fengzijianii]QDQ98747.1 hypothetical protein FO059_17165 [Tomitella fengzijianii]